MSEFEPKHHYLKDAYCIYQEAREISNRQLHINIAVVMQTNTSINLQ